MAVSNIRADFHAELQKVWEIVTSLEDTAWRSDLSRVEIIDDKQFVEYTTSGCQTTFTVTVREKNAGAGNLIWRMIICMGIGQGFSPAKAT